MKLLVAIACYKVVDLTIDCLRSLAAEIPNIPGAKVAVCENGTGGDAADRLRRAIAENGWGSWVELTVIYPNRGFTGGTNVLLREAMASDDPPEYVLLLNADTIVKPGAVQALIDFMDRHPRAGIAGSQLLSLEGEIQASPFRFMGIVSEFDRGLRLGIVSKLLSPWALVPPPPAEDVKADWICPASALFRTSMLEEIGLLDEGLFTYFDDIDICLRAKRAGWECWFVPGSKVVHLEGSSTGVATGGPPRRRPAYWYQARRRFFLKSYGPVYTALADAAFISGFALWRLRRWIQRKPDTDPRHMLADSIRHSVFCTGFQVREVPNPALAGAPTPPPEVASSSSVSG
ncbi:glycosyltransferase family 2 protein [Tautonia sociabilis]|uniref:Glycosyltransferase family 2 protein n=1 Tax=Tautonia sociabilis TaxID=2080755 RepID=A0A432MER9_9BACT|nr:glycosyltransferase family 2 protein [Tautonia sociabilis]RUL84188.1 glycosyltransferase family 2 protein [Tautonia sociabilis]